MITVATFNAAMDRSVDVDVLRIGAVVRAWNTRALPGGKGTHVALAIAALGEPVRLVAVVDSHSEPTFREFLEPRGVEFHGIVVRGRIRTCLAIRERLGRLTEILEAGPALSESEQAAAISGFFAAAQGASVTVLAGSLPPGMSPKTYADMGRTVARQGARCVVDTSGDALAAAAAAPVFAIKPNAAEASELTGERVETPADARRAIGQLTRDGMNLALVSLGPSGAVAAWQGRTCEVNGPVVPHSQNTVGAGDCLVGGLAVGLARGMPVDDTLRLAVACGSAKVLCDETGLMRRPDVDRLLADVHVRWFD